MSKLVSIVLLLLSLQLSAADLNLGKYKGKVVYVDFWASWCGPCRQSFPWMNKMYQRYADQGFAVVGINVDADREEADEFLEELPAQFDIVFDPDGQLAEQQGVMGMPSSYLFDGDGRLISSHIGFNPDKAVEMEGEIKKALAHLKTAASSARPVMQSKGGE